MPRPSKFYLTAERLRANNACEEQVVLFEQTFGKGALVLVNDENFRKAVDVKLSIWWVALKYLPTADYDEADLTYLTLCYEAQAERYWAAIKARMKADNLPRPSEWY